MNNHKSTIEKIKVGQSAEFLKLISEEDIKQFARLTGDNNPIHLDDEYAKKNYV